ncbi:DUF3800 domain-containing protein [Sphingomonas sp. C3-2]|uniref:DUF3800 domain-containing protein n=1 Tax=Sphingomonas sp. C3-2 TaxID=3062169 RepID=UPI00294AFC6D|nr:DUF3800 domain-containing protein [Sphingomonas sp. C3-2]WOK35327.1 DUF3800 domain-containing protein [Sphingomonas sp. C3-2]
MPIYCDESGGVSAGAMVFAAVSIDADAADDLLDRFKTVTGLRGEMKGSRISLVERALFFELLERYHGRAIVAAFDDKTMPRPQPGEQDFDLKVYVRLLEQVVGAWLPEVEGCAEIVIDDGRYSPAMLAAVRADIAALIGTCGRTELADSRRSAGVQIADVIANSFYNLAIRSTRSDRVQRIVAPFLQSSVLRLHHG